MNRTIRKTLAGLLCLALVLSLLPALAVPANAAAPRLTYELSVAKPADSTDDNYDPHDIYVKAGETFELTFTVHFLDSVSSYDLRWMQNELLYDSGFFYTSRTRGANNLIDVSFVQYLGMPMVKFSTMNVTLTGRDTAVASVMLRARTNLADGTTTVLRSTGTLCYDGNNERCAISAQDVTVTIGTRPLPTSSVHYNTVGGTMDPTAFPETDAEYVDYEDEHPYYAQTVLTGAAVTLPGAPAREGYSFNGWSDGATTYAAGASYTVNADTDFTAQWLAWPVVTLNAAGGTLSGESSYSIAPNTGLQLPSPTRSGYTFLGWSDGVSTTKDLYIAGTSNVTLNAQWAQRYTLTFDAGEGTLVGNRTASALAGDSVSLPSARRTGFQFSGWSYNGNAVGASFTMPAADATLTALWTENPSVLLDANGGIYDGQTTHSAAPGESIDLPTLTRTGYLFGGWSDGSGTYTNSYTLGESSVTLKAIWTACTHTNAVYAETGKTDWTHVAGGHTHTRTVYSTATCPDCGEVLNKSETETANCSYSDGWTITAAGHSHACSVCGDVADSAAHTYGSNGKCTVCGFENPVIVMPASDNVASKKLEVSVSGTTVTYGSISDSELNQLASGGSSSDPIVIDAAAKGRIDTVSLPSGLASKVAALSNASGLTVTLTTGELTFNDDALKAIASAGSGALILTLKSGTLASAQQTAVKELDVKSTFSVTATVNGKPVTSFNGGKATVSVAFSPASGTSGNDYVVYYVAADGKTEKMATTYANGKLTFTTTHFSDYVVAYEKPPVSFVDVATGAYYADAVQWAVEKGITNGTDDTHFSPDAGCTRAQAVTFLYRAAGSPDVSVSDSFSDVPANQYYAKAVAWAVANGITNGTGDKTFSPDATCTRAQIVTFLMRYEKAAAASASKFADVSADAYYAGAVGWAVTNGITNGTGDNTFSPDATCTRAQIVTFLYRDFVKA